MKPDISFVMPIYNKQGTLIQSFQSIMDQNISNWEVIAVNDASTDSSQNILSEIREPRMQKVFLPVNKGVVNAYREGIKRAKADYVIFHDSDDVSLPDRAKKCLENIGDADVLYHGIYLISKNPKYPIISKRYLAAEKWSPKKIYTKQYIPGVICAKREILLKIDFPKEAESAWDWMHHILLHQMGVKYKALDLGLYEYYRFVDNSLSHTNELTGDRQNAIKWIQDYLIKNNLVKKGHKFGKGFKGFNRNAVKESPNLPY